MMKAESASVEKSFEAPLTVDSAAGSKKAPDVKEVAVEQGRGPEDTEGSRDGSSDSLGKRKARDEPVSPERKPTAEADDATTPFRKKEKNFFDDIGQESPASFPKHVMVPEHQVESGRSKEDFATTADEKARPTASVLTPDSISGQRRQSSFDVPPYSRPNSYHNEAYQPPSSYSDVDYARASYCQSTSQSASPSASASADHPRADGHGTRARRWACDFCNVATFLSYEEACAHEEVCARRHGTVAQNPRQPPPPHLASANNSFGLPPGHPHHHPAIPHPASHQQGLYQPTVASGSQEVVTPPTPHRYHARSWGSRGPPLPVLPHEHGYYHGYYDREDPAYYPHPEQYYSPQHSHSYGYGGIPSSSSQGSHPSAIAHVGSSGGQTGGYQKRMLLAMPADNESLSDRQCYVRSEMCEIFAATEHDVSARHSKGAQKLVAGQVGIRCIHCAHLRPRDRAERAVCYPSSISRIYQTVADMQRFHFEHCKEIPKHVQNVYKNLKTTRPRGVGSPQTYWVQSAKQLGLIDGGNGICFDTDSGHVMAKENPKQPRLEKSGGHEVQEKAAPAASAQRADATGRH